MPDYAITEYNLTEGEIGGADIYNLLKHNPDKDPSLSTSAKLDHEEVLRVHYENQGYGTQKLSPDTKFRGLQMVDQIPDELIAVIRQEIARHTKAQPFNSKKRLTWPIEAQGIPDFLMYRLGRADMIRDYWFVEAKTPNDGPTFSQIEWMTRFNFFPIRIAYVKRLDGDE